MKQIALNVPEELHERVKNYAKTKYSSVAQIVRNLINEHIPEDKNEC